jgi:hypothetical protein
LAKDGPGGFLDGPHLPKLLFEAHHFDRLTGGKFRASHPNLSSRGWNRSLYVGGQGEWVRLHNAIQLDRNAALQSASYGGPQIMGFNYRLAGFGSVEAFVDAMKTTERAHLEAFVSFIINSGLGDELRKISDTPADCAAFARGYNGSRQDRRRAQEAPARSGGLNRRHRWVFSSRYSRPGWARRLPS